MGILRRLFGSKPARPREREPASMFDLRSGDPCWCGSEKAYRKCHRKVDKLRLAEALGKRAHIVEALT